MRSQNKTGYVLPVGLGSSPSRVASCMELESDKAKSVGNSNLLAIQHLLVSGHFNTAEGPIVNDHQIEGREILWSLQLQKGIGFEIRPISQVIQSSTRRG